MMRTRDITFWFVYSHCSFAGFPCAWCLIRRVSPTTPLGCFSYVFLAYVFYINFCFFQLLLLLYYYKLLFFCGSNKGPFIRFFLSFFVGPLLFFAILCSVSTRALFVFVIYYCVPAHTPGFISICNVFDILGTDQRDFCILLRSAPGYCSFSISSYFLNNDKSEKINCFKYG